ncbi:PAS domain-containing sensor histidine kinase [Algoriphagus marincola]|uniref:histidine kinase n=1 Tax=Algoriphagus marincola TaxID=264027 RepID=A0ABS7N1K4_9BACT|nr:histidine kinase N-terminal 7TM domain-containing protein [Algoriphagus marincola]MBY5949870.1 PAS domain-containing sensor histidine kinase [Algoriphagus marincola]
MDFSFNAFSVSLIISSLAVMGISASIAFRLDTTTRWIAMTMFFITVWGFFYGLELASTTLKDMLLWVKFEYIGISFAPALWLIFTLKYTGYRNWAKPPVLIGSFTIPAITLLMVISNELHGLYYEKTFLVLDGPFPILGIEKGPYYIIHVIYSYVAFLLGTIILWRRFEKADQLFKNQTKLLIAAGAFPIVFNLFYQTGVIKLFGYVDLTPFAFLFTYLVLGIAILRYGLFSIKPIAQGKIMEALTKGVLVFNSSNKVVDFNPTARAFCAEPKKIRIGATLESIFWREKAILELFNGFEQKTIVHKPSFGDTTIRVEIIPIRDKEMEDLGNILLIDDITEEIKTNQQLQKQKEDLQQLNDLKDKFFSIISHDLKGPIFGVKELVHMTQTGLISQDEFLEMMPEVSKNMEQVAILLENLLAWASSQIRGEQVDIQQFDILPLVNQQKKLLNRLAEDKKVKIEIDIEESIRVSADRNMIDLVLRNLITNAIKFSRAGDRILLSASKEKYQAKICIKDSGVGISRENIQKIQQGESFTTRGLNNETGTGLGLVLVREYIFKNKGKLEIESEEGNGSTFCVYLPLAD